MHCFFFTFFLDLFPSSDRLFPSGGGPSGGGVFSVAGV